MTDLLTPPAPVVSTTPPPNAAPAPDPAPSINPSSTTPSAPDPFLSEIDAAFSKDNEKFKEPIKDEGKAKEPAAKPSNTPAAPPKPAVVPPKPPEGPKALREELDRTKGELKAKADEMTALQTKLKDFESKGKDTEALLERLKQRETEFDKLQGEIRALKQEASPEFKKQYEEPFNRAADYAAEIVKSILKPDNTQADFDKDFVPIYNLARSNYGRAAAEARELFGEDAAPAVMDQVRELRRLETQKTRAFEDEKKGWAEKQKADEAKEVQSRHEHERKKQEHEQKVTDARKKVSEDLRNKEEWFRDPVDDTERIEARKTGWSEVRYAPKSLGDQIVWQSKMEHRAAAYPVLQLVNTRQASEIKALKEQVESLKGGQPLPGGRKSGASETPPEQDWEAETIRRVKAA